MSKRSGIFGLRNVAMLFLASLLMNGAARAEKSTRPNIVWVFSDDHTRQAIGAYGSRLAELDPTPHLDRLAAEGMRFDRCYVGNSICAPSRATLLTGKHSHVHGKTDNRGGFNHDQPQFQKLLQANGYQTAMIGKIHLHGKMQGFDYWEVLPGQGAYYQPEFVSEEGRKKYTGYVGDIITEKSIDWLKNRRDTKKPFMLMVHHKGTHRTWMPASRHVGLYDDVTVPEPKTLFDDYEGRGTAAREQDMSIDHTMNMPNDLKVRSQADMEKRQARYTNDSVKVGSGERGAYFRMNEEQGRIWDAAYGPRNEAFRAANLKPHSPEWIRWKYQRYVKDYLRTAKSIDESMGQILAYLEESGLDKNTIVMYSSDQGFYLGEHGWFDKRFMYEESYSTPFIVKWPGVVAPGSVNDDLVQNIDWAETFLEIADVGIPNDMQGKSLVPLLKGETPADWRTSLYYGYYEFPHGSHRVRRHEGVSTERYKLIRFYGPEVPDGEEWELYDLERDPQEMRSIYNHPEKAALVAELKAELQRLRSQYKVPDEDR